jgi:hypothetical protein
VVARFFVFALCTCAVPLMCSWDVRPLPNGVARPHGVLALLALYAHVGYLCRVPRMCAWCKTPCARVRSCEYAVRACIAISGFVPSGPLHGRSQPPPGADSRLVALEVV